MLVNMKNPKTGKRLRIPSKAFFDLIADGYVHDPKNNCLVKDPNIKTPVKVLNPFTNRYMTVGSPNFMKVYNLDCISYWPEKNQLIVEDSDSDDDIPFDEDIYDEFMYDGDISIE